MAGNERRNTGGGDGGGNGMWSTAGRESASSKTIFPVRPPLAFSFFLLPLFSKLGAFTVLRRLRWWQKIVLVGSFFAAMFFFLVRKIAVLEWGGRKKGYNWLLVFFRTHSFCFLFLNLLAAFWLGFLHESFMAQNMIKKCLQLEGGGGNGGKGYLSGFLLGF